MLSGRVSQQITKLEIEMNHLLIKFQGYHKFHRICSEDTCISQIPLFSVEFIVAISKGLEMYLLWPVVDFKTCWFVFHMYI
jgi:hypothetical protein